MGKIGMPGGGGGADTSVVTATASDVLSGKVIVDADGNPLNGTIPTQASRQDASYVVDSSNGEKLAVAFPVGYYKKSNATNVDGLPYVYVPYATLAEVLGVEASKMLATETIAGVKGTIVDQGAKTSSLNCGGSYTIPAGYHNGSGKITANSLSSQTSANATAAQILKDKTAWVNGSKLTGTLAVNSAISFSAAALSSTSIRISWKNPSKGPWTGVFIQGSSAGNPGTSGGTRVYTGRGNSTTAGGSNYADITGLTPGTTYYFTCTSYVDNVGNGSSYNVSAKTSGLLLYNEGNNPAGFTYTYNSSAGVSGNGITFNSDHILVDEGNTRTLYAANHREPLYREYSRLCVDVTFVTYPVHSTSMKGYVNVCAHSYNSSTGGAYTIGVFDPASAGARKTYSSSLANASSTNNNNHLALHIETHWGPNQNTNYGTKYPKMKYHRIWLE